MPNVRSLLCAVAVCALLGLPVAPAQTVWSGLDFEFTKPNYADWTLPENQDRITDSVWITRQNTQGIYNVFSESGYSSFSSPADTEWAYGDATNWQNLAFTSWEAWHGSSPPSVVGQDAVVHLISDDIYIDIKFTSWTSGGQGGGFTYMRGVPEPASLGLLGVAALLLRRR